MPDELDPDWLERSYAAFPQVEDAFHSALAESLDPRGPEVLYELVERMALPAGSVALDVGCGEGRHAAELAARFGFDVTGVDPVGRHLEAATAAFGERARFVRGRVEELPVESGSVDLAWCRDVLVHVADLERAYAELARVLRPGGRALVYQMVAGAQMELGEADRVFAAAGVVPGGLDPARAEMAIMTSGLRVDGRVELTTEWGEWAEERDGKPGTRLLWAARLLRQPERYVKRFGRAAYEIMLADCLWHVYAMLGKLERRAYLLSKD